MRSAEETRFDAVNVARPSLPLVADLKPKPPDRSTSISSMSRQTTRHAFAETHLVQQKNNQPSASKETRESCSPELRWLLAGAEKRKALVCVWKSTLQQHAKKKPLGIRKDVPEQNEYLRNHKTQPRARIQVCSTTIWPRSRVPSHAKGFLSRLRIRTRLIDVRHH